MLARNTRYAAATSALSLTLAALIGGCQPQSSSTPAPSTAAAPNAEADANKAVYQKLNDAFAAGDTSIVDQVLAGNVVDHMVPPPGLASGREGLKQQMLAMKAGFPDLQSKIVSMVGEGDRLAAYFVMSGTNTGEFMGMKPTGKKIRVEGFDLVRFEGGKMAEHWGVNDNMAMMQQLGMLPSNEEMMKEPKK